jgi:hypothetical protein
MELLDHYLKTVETYLPKAQRADIIRELSDNIRSQMEDRKAELGRPLSEAEQEAILKQVGNPLLVAGRYQKDQRTLTFGRQLIGPALFPLYAKILTINLTVTVVICFVAVFILAYLGKSATQFVNAPAIVFQLFIQFSIVTAIFTAAETSLARNAKNWDPQKPSSLLPVPKEVESRLASLLELVITSVFFFWWLSVLNYVPGVLSSIGNQLTIGPGIYMLYSPILLLSLAHIGLAVFKLVRPRRTPATSLARPALTGTFVAVLCISLVAGHWVVLGEAAGQASQLGGVVEEINQWTRIGLIIGAAVGAIQLFLEVRRVISRRPGSMRPNGNALVSSSL